MTDTTLTTPVPDEHQDLEPEQQEALANCVDDWFTVERARDYVQSVVAKSGTSFGPGMAILSRPQREAMYGIYAFCRDVDDTADDADKPCEERLEQLALWRAEIDALYGDDPNWLTSLALMEPVYRFGLPKDEFIAMIDGMAMDAAETMRAPSREELALYTRRVAGSVGVLSMHVFGASDDHAIRFATTLGDAFQLTNILRDIAEDGARGRLYLPRELLVKHAIPVPDTADAVMATIQHPNLGKVCAELSDQAAAYYETCHTMVREIDTASLRSIRVMWRIYEQYLTDMRSLGWAKPLETIRYSKAKKLWLAAMGLLR